MAEKLRPFHLAIPVSNLNLAKKWYGTILECSLGRQTVEWIDFNFFGHQISAHLKPDALRGDPTNEVDGDNVPVRHFGAVLPWESWHDLVDRLRAHDTTFLIEPHIRFEGQPGEQATVFIHDPSGNALEFKAFRDPSQLFATD